MAQVTQLTNVSPNELVELIKEGIKTQLQEFSIQINSKQISDKPILSRQETANFFGVSLNCINDWSNKGIIKPIKVGQRTYFNREELLQVMFKKSSNVK
jgi:hypothetical protein